MFRFYFTNHNEMTVAESWAKVRFMLKHDPISPRYHEFLIYDGSN